MELILNEKRYAEKCIRDRTMGNNSWSTAQILAKYFYSIGHRRKQIEKDLTEFVSQNDPQYRTGIVRWQENIEKLAANAGKYKLFEHNSIPITKKEFDMIANCGLSKQHQQVLFSYLCLAKLGNMRNVKNSGWVNHKTRDVFLLAHVSLSEVKQDFMINDFYIRGLVELPKKNDNLSVRIPFCDELDAEVFLSVTDLRDLGYYYLMQTGENIVACAECGVLMRGNKAGTKKYCNNCAGYIPQEFKMITCVDCGREFKVAGNNKRTIRCESCQKEHVREYDRLRKKNSVF